MNRTVNAIVSEINKLKLKDIKGCEVGVWKGHTSEQILTALPKLHLTMVDSWSYFGTQMSNVKGQQQVDDAMQEAIDITSFATGRTTICHRTSKQAVELFDDSWFDFIYIDADHKYESIKEDINLWWPKIKKGGLFMGHDYGGRGDKKARWGIKKAVDEFVEEHELDLKIITRLVWRIQK